MKNQRERNGSMTTNFYSTRLILLQSFRTPLQQNIMNRYGNDSNRANVLSVKNAFTYKMVISKKFTIV